MTKKQTVKEWIKQEQGKHFCQCGCGGEIKIIRNHHSAGIPDYVSNHHLWKGGDVNTKCDYCSKDYIVKLHRYNQTKQHFCSRECYNNNNNQNHIKSICNYCGKELEITPHKYENSKNHFCDKGCKGKWQSENIKGKNNPSWKNSKIKTICDFCNKEYEIFLNYYQIRENHFCSRECMGKWNSENKIKENANAWQGGYIYDNPYCIKFNEKLREQIRNNYSRHCALCGKSETNKKHSVHHVDYDKSQGCNGQDILMVPLCQSCHGKTNSKKKRDCYEKLFTTIELIRIAIIEYDEKIDYRSLL